MADEVNEDQLQLMLEHVLEPLAPEVRTEILSLAREHLRTTPLYAFLSAEAEGYETRNEVFEFKVAEPNPIDPENTVFAIFFWHDQGVYVVYSFKAGIITEGEGKGGALGIFTRDIVHKPRFASGPLTLDALVADLEFHLQETPWPDDEPDEPEPPAPAAVRSNNVRPRG